MESTVTCRAQFEANLLGVDFQVTGTAYLQQDARVGACAQVSIWAGMRHLHARRMLVDRGLPVNERLLDELQDAHSQGHIVLRTYLTSVAGYRRHIADGTAGDDLKDALLALHLPHFTWITEIATIDSYNNFSAGMRRIYGHTIIDATSTGRDGDGLLALHLPGLLFTKDVNAPRHEQENLAIIEGDDLYECRAKNR